MENVSIKSSLNELDTTSEKSAELISEIEKITLIEEDLKHD